jgi:hypothetical protein
VRLREQVLLRTAYETRVFSDRVGRVRGSLRRLSGEGGAGGSEDTCSLAGVRRPCVWVSVRGAGVRHAGFLDAWETECV